MKILVVYATAGIGHKKAAFAIIEALYELKGADTEIAIIDALDYAPTSFKWLYLKFYLLAVNKFSYLWGLMYYLTDNFYINLVVSKLRRLNNWLNSRMFVKYLTEFKPDVIISTHFFASEVASSLKSKGRLDAHIITVVTDFRLHSWWIADFVDTYIVANGDAAQDLARWRVDPSKVKVLGIPASPVFARSQDETAIRAKFGLEKDIFTILVIGGGFGVGPIEDIVKAIGCIESKLQTIVVCGHNEELIKRMEDLKPSIKARLLILGFVDNVYDFMQVSDILISKSGGITVTESLIKELPMIVIAPIPGQEKHNSDFLLRHGAALRLDSPAELKGVLGELIKDSTKLTAMKEAIRNIRKPAACYDIAKLALEIARKS